MSVPPFNHFFVKTPESSTITKNDLGNTLYSESFINPTSIIIQQDLDGYIALKDENSNYGNSGVITKFIDVINQDPDKAISVNASVRNIDLKDFIVVDNGKILNDDVVTKFYVGSLYVIGLYVFYRILVKNN